MKKKKNTEAFTLPEKDFKLISQDYQGVAQTRHKETNLGDVFNDVLVYDSKERIKDEADSEEEKPTKEESKKPTKIDFAITNGGSLRTNIIPTEKDGKFIVTNGDIDATSQFGNTLEVVELDGKTIHEMFTHSAKTLGAGSFLQVSKEVEITYAIDKSDPTGSKNKIKTLKINGKEVKNDDSEKYYMVTNDFLLAGGDGYSMLTGKSTGVQGASISESLKKYGKYLSENQNKKETTSETLPKWDD